MPEFVSKDEIAAMLGNKQNKEDMSRWYLKCKTCGKEAMGLYTYTHPGDWEDIKGCQIDLNEVTSLDGAKVYYRGHIPFTINNSMLDKGKVKCANCRTTLINIDQVEICKEEFTVKSLMRLMETLSLALETHTSVLEIWPRLLEYGFMFQMDQKTWEEMNKLHVKNVTLFKNIIKELYDKQSVLGKPQASGIHLLGS